MTLMLCPRCCIFKSDVNPCSHFLIKKGSILSFQHAIKPNRHMFAKQNRQVRYAFPMFHLIPASNCPLIKEKAVCSLTLNHSFGCNVVCHPSQMRLKCGWDSQRILGEIFQGTHGCPLAVPVSWSNHQAHLLPQPIPSSHINPRKSSHLNDPSHIPTPPPGCL